MHRGRIFVPDSSAFWTQLLHTAHGASHEGVQKTLHRLHASYSPRASRRVRDFVRGCVVCQRNKMEHLHPTGLLQPLDVPHTIWADITMDFVEGFPKVGGKSVVLMVVDRFSVHSHFIALGHPYSTTSVAQAFFDQIVRLHGLSVVVWLDSIGSLKSRGPDLHQRVLDSAVSSVRCQAVSAPLSTHKLTVNQRSLIGCCASTFVALSTTVREVGCGGCHDSSY